MIAELRDRNEKLLNSDLSNGDYLKQCLIKKILSDDKCFSLINMNDAYNILLDLGYKEEEVIDVYESLLDK